MAKKATKKTRKVEAKKVSPLGSAFNLEGLEELASKDLSGDMKTAEGVKHQLEQVVIASMSDERYNDATQALREISKLNGFDKKASMLEGLSERELKQRLAEALSLLSRAGLRLK